MIKVDIQTAVKNEKLPSKTDFRKWISKTIEIHAKTTNQPILSNFVKSCKSGEDDDHDHRFDDESEDDDS